MQLTREFSTPGLPLHDRRWRLTALQMRRQWFQRVFFLTHRVWEGERREVCWRLFTRFPSIQQVKIDGKGTQGLDNFTFPNPRKRAVTAPLSHGSALGPWNPLCTFYSSRSLFALLQTKKPLTIPFSTFPACTYDTEIAFSLILLWKDFSLLSSLSARLFFSFSFSPSEGESRLRYDCLAV